MGNGYGGRSLIMLAASLRILGEQQTRELAQSTGDEQWTKWLDLVYGESRERPIGERRKREGK